MLDYKKIEELLLEKEDINKKVSLAKKNDFKRNHNAFRLYEKVDAQ